MESVVLGEKDTFQKWRVMLDFSGIQIPMTNNMFPSKSDQEKIASKLNDWLFDQAPKLSIPIESSDSDDDKKEEEEVPEFHLKEKWSN